MSPGEDLLREIGGQVLVAGETKAPGGDSRVVALEELVEQAISLCRAEKSEGAVDQLFGAGLLEVHRSQGVTQIGVRPITTVLASIRSSNTSGQRLAQ